MQGKSLCSLRQAQLIVQFLPCQNHRQDLCAAANDQDNRLYSVQAMGLNNDHLLQEQMAAGVGDNSRDSRSQIPKCKVPDGARAGMGSPLGCLQNRPLLITMAGAC